MLDSLELTNGQMVVYTRANGQVIGDKPHECLVCFISQTKNRVRIGYMPGNNIKDDPVIITSVPVDRIRTLTSAEKAVYKAWLQYKIDRKNETIFKK